MKSAWSAWSAKALLTWALWLSIGEAALTRDSRDTLSSGSPVAKIVEMLKDMSSKSEEDGKAEEETFSSFKCHSTKVIESKATKMSDLEELSLSLENKIEKLTALKGELASKAVSVKKDLEKNDETKREADNTRENSHKSFLSSEKEMTANLKTLSQALTSLKETEKKSEATELLAMSSNAELAALGRQLQEVQNPSQPASAFSKDFLSPKDGLALLGGAPGNYESQSGGVLGVLTSTRDTYAKDLETLQQTEASQKDAFDKMTATLLSKKKELAELLRITEASRASTEEEIETRKSQLKEAKKNLATETDLKAQEEKTLASKTAVYEQRKSLRSEEETAIAQAIAVLNSDSSFATFTAVKTSPSFLQLGRSTGLAKSVSRGQAIQFLRQEAHARSSTKLAHLAVLLSSESANPFGKVLGEIEKMQETIVAEGKADKKKFDWCAAERAKSKESKTEKETQIGNFKAALLELKGTLTGPVDGLEATLSKAEEDLKENEEDQEKETADRKKENKEYQKNIANLQNAQGLVDKALSVLKKFYAKVALTQVKNQASEQATEDPEYDEGDFKGQASGGKVQELLKAVLDDTAKEEADAHKAEQDAQIDFEDRLALLTRSAEELGKTITDTQKAIADAKVKVTENKEMKADAEKEKKSIEEYLFALYGPMSLFELFAASMPWLGNWIS